VSYSKIELPGHRVSKGFASFNVIGFKLITGCCRNGVLNSVQLQKRKILRQESAALMTFGKHVAD
jgi:hypothetical protein